jgi:hypothetical protein
VRFEGDLGVVYEVGKSQSTSQPHDPVDILDIHCDLIDWRTNPMHLRFLGWVDMKIGGCSRARLIAVVVVEVSSDWPKIDKKAMPILGRFALQNVAAGQGFPPLIALYPNLDDRSPPVPYIRPKRKGPTRDGMRWLTDFYLRHESD